MHISGEQNGSLWKWIILIHVPLNPCTMGQIEILYNKIIVTVTFIKKYVYVGSAKLLSEVQRCQREWYYVPFN